MNTNITKTIFSLVSLAVTSLAISHADDSDFDGLDDFIQTSNFTNYSFGLGDLSQWQIIGGGTKQVYDDAAAVDGKAAYFREWAVGIQLKSPAFTPIAGNILEARFYNPGGISSCGLFVWQSNDQEATKLVESEDLGFTVYRFDLTAWAGQPIQVGFGGGKCALII